MFPDQPFLESPIVLIIDLLLVSGKPGYIHSHAPASVHNYIRGFGRLKSLLAKDMNQGEIANIKSLSGSLIT